VLIPALLQFFPTARTGDTDAGASRRQGRLCGPLHFAQQNAYPANKNQTGFALR
jgi:hypothetical protein